MNTLLVMCRGCDIEFALDHRAVVSGVCRLCTDCREGDDTLRGPVGCPICHQVLRSGEHRGLWPGRRRRSRSPP